jgi:hypothetical protein
MYTDIKALAKTIAAKGRHGDKHLIHISEKELGDLVKTGKITLNPDTGLPEAFSLGDIGDAIGSGFNRFLNPFSDKNVFRNELGAIFPLQNPDVQQAAGVAGGALLGAQALGLPGASAGGAAGGESFVGPATGAQLASGPQASGALAAPAAGAGSPVVSGIAEGAGSFIPTAIGQGASNALNLPNPVTGQAPPTTGAVPGATPPAGPPGATPPPAAPANTASRFTANILKQMGDNALALGLIGGSMLSAGQQAPMPSQEQLQGLSAEAQATANQLLAQYRAGQLSASQQAGLDQLTQQTKNQVTQYFASIGQADSTAHQQALAQVDQQAFGMRQQMLSNMLTQGLQAIGVASGPLQTIAQYQMGQDQALRQAFGGFAGAVGQLFGRQAGTQQPQQPAPAPQQRQPTGTVTSAQ